MNYSEYCKKFTAKAHKYGRTDEFIETCLSYAKPLLDKSFPVIYSTKHLAQLVGYKKNYLKRAIKHPHFFYRTYTINKKNGGHRIISEPLPSLKEIQQWILNKVLYKKQVSRYAKAYIPKQTLKDHLKYHRRQKIVFSLDIENFFSSISFDKIEAIFCEFGYSDPLANLMAKICTLDNQLPQGAPTSPYLSNIYLFDFDQKIAKYCSERKIRYTRYADDITFSGEYIETDKLVSFIQNELSQLHLKLNTLKTTIAYNNQRQIIAGVVVNEKLQLPKKERDNIRKSVYYINKYGLEEHLDRINCDKVNYIFHLLGRINYMLFINPKDKKAKEYKAILKQYL